MSPNLNIEHFLISYISCLSWFSQGVSMARELVIFNGMLLFSLSSSSKPQHTLLSSVLNAIVTFLLSEHCYHHIVFYIPVENSNYLRHKNKTLGLNLLIRLSQNSHWGILTHSPMCLIIHLRIFEIHSIYICVKDFCTSASSSFPIAKM